MTSSSSSSSSSLSSSSRKLHWPHRELRRSLRTHAPRDDVLEQPRGRLKQRPQRAAKEVQRLGRLPKLGRERSAKAVKLGPRVARGRGRRGRRGRRRRRRCVAHWRLAARRGPHHCTRAVVVVEDNVAVPSLQLLLKALEIPHSIRKSSSSMQQLAVCDYFLCRTASFLRPG